MYTLFKQFSSPHVLSSPLSHLICVSCLVLSIKTIYCKLLLNNVKWSFTQAQNTPPPALDPA